MLKAVILDSHPAGLISRPKKNAEAFACDQWMNDLISRNVRVFMPEIIDYELRRELLRLNRQNSIALLDLFNQAEPDRYLPITTDVMATLWAQARQQGIPTADPKALDVDVILAAQALSLGLPATDFVVATSNPAHLARFVPADTWQNIKP